MQVGVKKASQLTAQHRLPFIGVHHLEAHALMARQAQDIAFPFLCLLVSGGHSLLLVVHGVGDYTLLGSSLDDAVGQCQPWLSAQATVDASRAKVSHVCVNVMCVQGLINAVLPLIALCPDAFPSHAGSEMFVCVL